MGMRATSDDTVPDPLARARPQLGREILLRAGLCGEQRELSSARIAKHRATWSAPSGTVSRPGRREVSALGDLRQRDGRLKASRRMPGQLSRIHGECVADEFGQFLSACAMNRRRLHHSKPKAIVSIGRAANGKMQSETMLMTSCCG